MFLPARCSKITFLGKHFLSHVISSFSLHPPKSQSPSRLYLSVFVHLMDSPFCCFTGVSVFSQMEAPWRQDCLCPLLPAMSACPDLCLAVDSRCTDSVKHWKPGRCRPCCPAEGFARDILLQQGGLGGSHLVPKKSLPPRGVRSRGPLRHHSPASLNLQLGPFTASYPSRCPLYGAVRGNRLRQQDFSTFRAPGSQLIQVTPS